MEGKEKSVAVGSSRAARADKREAWREKGCAWVFFSSSCARGEEGRGRERKKKNVVRASPSLSPLQASQSGISRLQRGGRATRANAYVQKRGGVPVTVTANVQSIRATLSTPLLPLAAFSRRRHRGSVITLMKIQDPSLCNYATRHVTRPNGIRVLLPSPFLRGYDCPEHGGSNWNGSKEGGENSLEDSFPSLVSREVNMIYGDEERGVRNIGHGARFGRWKVWSTRE